MCGGGRGASLGGCPEARHGRVHGQRRAVIPPAGALWGYGCWGGCLLPLALHPPSPSPPHRTATGGNPYIEAVKELENPANHVAFTAAEMRANNCWPLEDPHGPGYAPTPQEVQEYARYLGIDTVHERALLWIAYRGLSTPLPWGWRACATNDGATYFVDFSTGAAPGDEGRLGRWTRRARLLHFASQEPAPPPDPRDALEGGGGRYPSPLQGAQPMPSHCPPDGNCQPQWHL